MLKSVSIIALVAALMIGTAYAAEEKHFDGHPQGHPQGNPPAHAEPVHPQGHPQVNPQGHPPAHVEPVHPQGHPQGHPQNNPQGHQQINPQGHPQGHPEGVRTPERGMHAVPPGVHHEQSVERHTFYRGRHYNNFSVQEREIWRSGHWDHGYHNGRYGWWWWTGGVWYFYAAPVYPYPLFVPEYEIDVYPDPAYVAPVEVWYYCDLLGAYYPYVTVCPGGWRAIPAY